MERHLDVGDSRTRIKNFVFDHAYWSVDSDSIYATQDQVSLHNFSRVYSIDYAPVNVNPAPPPPHWHMTEVGITIQGTLTTAILSNTILTLITNGRNIDILGGDSESES